MTLIELAGAVDLKQEGNYIEVVTGLFLHRMQFSTLLSNFPNEAEVEVVSDKLNIKWSRGEHSIRLKPKGAI